jgi:arylsulfatase A-like enzyme
MLAINPKGSSQPTAGAERPIPEGKPNILWVVYDTVRADHISAYGYPKQTSPNFDALAREGTVFDKTYTSAAWTVESHASMFTGKYASQHGCRHPTLFLGEQHKTIAQFLTEAGYDSSLYAGNPWLDHSTGLARGILDLSPTWRFSTTIAFSFVGRFWIDHIQGGGDKGAGLTNESFKHWYEAKRDKKRPFFAFVNYLEAHAPYFAVSPEDRHKFLPEGASDAEASELSAKIFNHMVFGLDYEFSRREMDIILAMYDAGIHNADRRMGELLDVLRKDGTLDNTLVIVTADHGELFDEHNMWGHDLALYNEVVHVPLVIRYPAKMPAGMRSDKPVQLLDLFATVMSAAGLSDRMPADARAQDILPLVAGGGDVNRPLFGEYFTPRMPPLVRDIQKMGKDPATFHINSVQQSNLKLIRWSDEARLFDLATDPREQTDLSSSRAEDKQRLNALIDDFVKANQAGTGGSSGGGELDEAMKQRLKSLGYIQ